MFRKMKITKLETIWFEAVPDAVWRQQSPNSRQALPNNLVGAHLYRRRTGRAGRELIIYTAGRQRHRFTIFFAQLL